MPASSRTGSMMCRLRLRLGDEWVTKVDVGGPSEQPDGGDRLKAAFSDALKRAAVKFGIGRYLYRLPSREEDQRPLPIMEEAAPAPSGRANRKPNADGGKTSAAGSKAPANGA